MTKQELLDYPSVQRAIRSVRLTIFRYSVEANPLGFGFISWAMRYNDQLVVTDLDDNEPVTALAAMVCFN